jgi:predicted nucleic acid-binding protein
VRLVLDSGALLALERGDRSMWRRIAEAASTGAGVMTTGAVFGQVWRGSGPRQALLSKVMAGVEVVPVDLAVGRAAGELLGAAGMSDVIDASLVAICEDSDQVFTSDPADLARLASCAGTHVEIVTV